MKNKNSVAGETQAPGCQGCLTRARCVVAAVPDEELHLVSSRVTERPVAKGAAVVVQGERPGVLRILKVGQIISTQSVEGVDVALMVVERGATMGLFGLLGQSVAVSATASAPSRICEIPLAALTQHPAWEGSIQRRVGELAHRHFMGIVNWSAAVKQSGTAARLAACLILIQEDAGAMTFRMPSNLQWSRLLGASRETVSRAVSQLDAQRCFARDGRVVRVDIEACRQVVRSQARTRRLAQIA